MRTDDKLTTSLKVIFNLAFIFCHWTKTCEKLTTVHCAFDDDKGVILAPFSINEEEKSDYGTSSKLQAVQSELCMPIVKSWNFWSCQTIVQKVCKGSDTHYLLPGVYLIFPRRALLDLIEQN